MYYFASDIHLGMLIGDEKPAAREQLLVKWLEEVSSDAKAIFLVGDIFDFWFEYKRVIPKGYVRLLGKLAELTDRGVEIHLMVGNHDIWAFDYLHSECGVTLHHEPYCCVELYGKRVLIGHGDLLGKRPPMARILSKLFRSRTVQRLFAMIHPDCAIRFAQGWSGSSRRAKPIRHTFLGERDPIVGFAREHLREHPIDLFVCGHTHCAEYYPLGEKQRGSIQLASNEKAAAECASAGNTAKTDTLPAITFLGEWFERPTYGVLSEEGFCLKSYPENQVIAPR